MNSDNFPHHALAIARTKVNSYSNTRQEIWPFKTSDEERDQSKSIKIDDSYTTCLNEFFESLCYIPWRCRPSYLDHTQNVFFTKKSCVCMSWCARMYLYTKEKSFPIFFPNPQTVCMKKANQTSTRFNRIMIYDLLYYI